MNRLVVAKLAPEVLESRLRLSLIFSGDLHGQGHYNDESCVLTIDSPPTRLF